MDPSVTAFTASLVTSVLVVLATMVKYFHHAQQARAATRERLRYEALASRVPDACRLEDLRDRVSKEEERLHAMRGQLREAQALIEERDATRGSLEKLKEEVRVVQQKHTEKSAELANVKEKFAALLEERKTARAELEHARRNIEKEGDAFRRVQAEHAETKASIEALRAERQSLNDSIAALRAMYERTVKESREARGIDGGDAEKDLWDPVFSKIKGRDRSRGERESLERVQSHLADQGLHFSDRTIRAFHTSLKISEMSPLVVLAGISGTGKSELPRRYSEAMGMHFLPIPVQPRWDSPQDLFGFFNYLEGRYRPTELTRALIQMDPYHAEEERGWMKPADWDGSVSSQMLLVLLDEMNLARVEYYFSEFLSKLETRRGVQKDRPPDRRKAEISLEVGRREDEAAIMRLFVDLNVLFVGTMNEDETTQTLSDKVVDRANVLRFGKPNLLRTRLSGSGRFLADCGVPYEAWKSWLQTDQDVDGALSSKVDEWIRSLNDAMQRIGRPFAHRTHQAIRSYVANYPEQGTEAVHQAMADQIEQRILPKFRGLDPGEPTVGAALEDVVRLIDDLGDVALRQSVDDARSAYHHQFNWQGVDRLAGDKE